MSSQLHDCNVSACTAMRIGILQLWIAALSRNVDRGVFEQHAADHTMRLCLSIETSNYLLPSARMQRDAHAYGVAEAAGQWHSRATHQAKQAKEGKLSCSTQTLRCVATT